MSEHEIYGKFVVLKKTSSGLTLVISREKEMSDKMIDYLNRTFKDQDIGIEIRILFNYRNSPFKSKVVDKDQKQLCGQLFQNK